MILCREQYAAAVDRCVFPGQQGGPLVHIVAAKAVCFLEALQPSFVEYQRQVIGNAQALAASMAASGYRVVSGGTDSHLVLVDVFAKGVRGKDAEWALDEAYMTANKNGIPFDVNPPLNPSGIRLGSPALTTRGFGEAEFTVVGSLIGEVLDAVAANGRDGAGATIEAVRAKVAQLTCRFPLYEWKQPAAARG
jgi:glycine hydroxymethyltransferase